MEENKVITAELLIDAPVDEIFELVADPAQQPLWDGNENLAQAPAGQRVHAVGDVFRMINVGDKVRENHVVEFQEGRLIAWQPSEVGKSRPGHLWRWEFQPQGPRRTLVRHTYDWTQLEDPRRMDKARGTRVQNLMASLERLKALAEQRSS